MKMVQVLSMVEVWAEGGGAGQRRGARCWLWRFACSVHTVQCSMFTTPCSIMFTPSPAPAPFARLTTGS